MTRRDFFGLVVIGVGLAAAAGLYWYLYLAPIVLRVAVAPAGSDTAQFFAGLAQASQRDRFRIRLNLAPLNNMAETSAAIDAGDVDLALARADYRLPYTGLAVAILHQNIVLLIACPAPPAAPPQRGRAQRLAPARAAPIQGFATLKGRRVAILGRGPANRALFDRLSAHHGLGARDLDVVDVGSAAEIAAASATRPVEALFMAISRGSSVIGESIRALRCPADGKPQIVPLESGLFQARSRVFGTVELAAGEFGTNPMLPAEAISTVSFPSLLMARRGLSNEVVEAFTRQLFTLRHGLMSQYPAAAHLEALPTDRGSAFTLHSGASAYYDGDAKGFFEQYETLIYVLLFGFSGMLSAAVWLWRSLFPRRRMLVHEEHRAFEALIAGARAAQSPAELDAIAEAMDQILAEISQNMLEGKVDLEMKPAFDIMTDRLSAVMAQRRAVLASRPEDISGRPAP